MYFLGLMSSIRLLVCGSCLSGAMTSRHTDCLCGCPFVVVLLQCPARARGPHDESEAKLLRLLRTFNAAAAEIVSMMPGARRLVPHQYKFRLETV